MGDRPGVRRFGGGGPASPAGDPSWRPRSREDGAARRLPPSAPRGWGLPERSVPLGSRPWGFASPERARRAASPWSVALALRLRPPDRGPRAQAEGAPCVRSGEATAACRSPGASPATGHAPFLPSCPPRPCTELRRRGDPRDGRHALPQVQALRRIACPSPAAAPPSRGGLPRLHGFRRPGRIDQPGLGRRRPFLALRRRRVPDPRRQEVQPGVDARPPRARRADLVHGGQERTRLHRPAGRRHRRRSGLPWGRRTALALGRGQPAAGKRMAFDRRPALREALGRRLPLRPRLRPRDHRGHRAAPRGPRLERLPHGAFPRRVSDRSRRVARSEPAPRGRPRGPHPLLPARRRTLQPAGHDRPLHAAESRRATGRRPTRRLGREPGAPP